ncbi:MAG: hypothetical protein Fur0010_22210 [Bdellovibrio sp.]
MKSIALLASLFFISSPLFAQDANRGSQLYQTCIECHGDKGQGNPEQAAPRLAGQHDWYILSSLIAFQKGERKNPKMLPFIKGLSEKDFKDLAAYISGLK